MPNTEMRVPVLLMARELHHLGGSERQMTEIAKALDRQVFDTHIGCFCLEGVRGDELRAAGLPVIPFPVNTYKSPSFLSGLSKIVRYVVENNIRIVHTWDYPTAVSVIPTIRLLTRAVALTSRRGHSELIPWVYQRATHISDRSAHGIIVNCEFLRRHLVKDEHVPERKVRLCYNGIDLNRFRRKDATKPAPVQRSTLVIGTVCALRREKDLATLIDAFADVRHLQPGMMLVIVGSGSELGRWQEQAKQRGVRDACHFEPATPHISAWLNAIDIFVLPSRVEAFSNALMEAMASGCCAVASRVGGNPELVRHEETGLLFQAGDPRSLAQELAVLIESPERRQLLAETGERFIQGFSIARAAQLMGEIYCDFLGRSNH